MPPSTKRDAAVPKQTNHVSVGAAPLSVLSEWSYPSAHVPASCDLHKYIENPSWRDEFSGYKDRIIERDVIKHKIKTTLERSRVVALIGPRQDGKTTLMRPFVSESSPNHFDLEDPLSLARLHQPMMALQELHNLIFIDEVQR